MNTDIMTTGVTKLNAKMKKEKSFFSWITNVSPHSRHLLFSNVKVVFLPANTTSRLQPLDAGIINNFKVHYRRQLLKHVLTKVNEEGASGSASSICKSVKRKQQKISTKSFQLYKMRSCRTTKNKALLVCILLYLPVSVIISDNCIIVCIHITSMQRQ